MPEMRMFNQDGSEARMCGNALRCIGNYIFNLKGVNQTNVLTGSGIHRLSKINNGLVQASMGEVKINPSIYQFTYNQVYFNGHFVEIGNYHFVSQWPEKCNLFEADNTILRESARLLQSDYEMYNVNYFQIIDDRTIKLRTVERGSGETLACGTGASSTAAVCVKNGLVKSNEVDVIMSGGKLHIGVTLINNQILINAVGEAKTVFRGTYRIE